MKLLALGLNHNSAPLDLRGRFAFTLDQLAPTLQRFRERLRHAPAHPEVAMLSTCNRTELYCAAESELLRPAIDWLAGLGGVTPRRLMDHAYVLEGEAAVRHAFRVASGLDSMVLGEPQILGQMKQAVREANDAGTLGKALHQLFQRSFSVAKEVRSSTEIGAHSISMAAASVRLARQLFGDDLRHTRVLFIGAGEMIELVATHFSAQAPRAIAVANRTLDKAQKLAGRLGADCLRLADLPDRLAEFDVVISCTASSLPIIGLGAVERASKARRLRPMLMIDLAVPRDIEPEVARLAAVHVYTVDDLSALVQTAGARRQAAVEQAEAIIDTGVRSFVHWLDQRATVPLIQALNAQADGWRAAALARARKSLARGDDVDAVLETLSRGLAQKMLHGAMVELHASTGEHRAQLASTVSRLFLRCPVRNPATASGAWDKDRAPIEPGRRDDAGNVVRIAPSARRAQ
jgi:glutamyl-tRNA reductase